MNCDLRGSRSVLPIHIGLVSLLLVQGSFSTGVIGQIHDADRMGAAATIVPPIAGLMPRQE